MQAVQLHSFGNSGVLRLEEVPKPTAGADQVLVRVGAAGVNPVDWKVRAGYLQSFIPHQLPLILGWDVSGVVEKTGPNVTAFAHRPIFARFRSSAPWRHLSSVKLLS